MIQPKSQHQRRFRPPTPLSSTLDRGLLAYTSAAVAAGVGILALSQPAAAKIIYKPANLAIGPNVTIPFDVNGDGTADFSFHDISTVTSFGGGGGALWIAPAAGANEIWGHTRSGIGSASALFAGVRVGPSPHFSAGNRDMAVSGSTRGVRHPLTFGPWVNVTNRYLGLKFKIKGKVHYGWARLNVAAANMVVTGTLTGYAYETVPGKALLTGKKKGTDGANDTRAEQGTLGDLAQGATGLEHWR
jgi:hypothetical protein